MPLPPAPVSTTRRTSWRSSSSTSSVTSRSRPTSVVGGHGERRQPVGVLAASTSSSGSCRRIRCWSARRLRPGSRPSSSSFARARRDSARARPTGGRSGRARASRAPARPREGRSPPQRRRARPRRRRDGRGRAPPGTAPRSRRGGAPRVAPPRPAATTSYGEVAERAAAPEPERPDGEHPRTCGVLLATCLDRLREEGLEPQGVDVNRLGGERVAAGARHDPERGPAAPCAAGTRTAAATCAPKPVAPRPRARRQARPGSGLGRVRRGASRAAAAASRAGRSTCRRRRPRPARAREARPRRDSARSPRSTASLPLGASVRPMSYAVVQDVPASWEHYASYAAALDGEPAGLVVHAAGPTDEGFRMIDVWESRAAWHRFRTERLEPMSRSASAAARLARARARARRRRSERRLGPSDCIREHR